MSGEEIFPTNMPLCVLPRWLRFPTEPLWDCGTVQEALLLAQSPSHTLKHTRLSAKQKVDFLKAAE